MKKFQKQLSLEFEAKSLSETSLKIALFSDFRELCTTVNSLNKGVAKSDHHGRFVGFNQYPYD